MNLSVEEYLVSKGLRPVRAGNNQLLVHCMFHDDSKHSRGKMYINAEHGAYQCKVCLSEGGFYSLMKHYGDEKEQRVNADVIERSMRAEILTDYVNHCHDVLVSGENQSILDYLIDRGISLDLVERYKIGFHASGDNVEALHKYGREKVEATGLLYSGGRWALAGQITIPYISNGRVLMVRGKDIAGKYKTLMGDQPRLFNGDGLKEADMALICEGEFDTLVLQELLKTSPDASLRNIAVVGVAGTGALPEGKDFPKYFEGFRRVYLGFDADNAGRKGAAALHELMPAQSKTLEIPEQGADWTDWLIARSTNGEYGKTWKDVQALIQEAEDRDKRVFSVSDAVRAYEEEEATGVGLRLGFPSLDGYFPKGFRRGNLIVPLAGTGVGKALAADTPILTPAGWTTQGRLRPWDYVFGPDGKPVKVIGVTPLQHGRPCYRVTFGGQSVVADELHEWTVEDFQGGTATVETRDLVNMVGKVFIPGKYDSQLLRKGARYKSGGSRILHRVEQVESVPVLCIQVDREDGLYLAGKGLLQTHNSLFVQNIMWNTRGVRTLAITPELTRAEVWGRLRKIGRFHMPWVESDQELANELPNLSIVEENKVRPQDVRMFIEEYAERHGGTPDVIHLDYLGYMARHAQGQSEYDRITNATMDLKALAKEYEAVIFAPHQVNRSGGVGEAPEADKGRGAGTVEETADVLLGLWTPWQKESGGRVGDEFMVRILKSRQGNRGREAQLLISAMSLVVSDPVIPGHKVKVNSENEQWNMGRPYDSYWDTVHRTAIAARSVQGEMPF